MRISAIWVKNAGVLEDYRLDIPLHGLTVFAAPNESGKSTLARVPFLLMTHPFSTTSKEIKSFRNDQEPSKPLVLGMEYWIGEKQYSIEKFYLSEAKAYFTQLAPTLHQKTNKEAEAALGDSLAGVDKTLLGLLSLEQGKNLSIFLESSLGSNETFVRLLNLASGPTAEGSNLPLAEAIEEEWLKYFTKSGSISSSKDSKSQVISQMKSQLNEMQKRVNAIRAKFSQIDHLQSQKQSAMDTETLKIVFECQQKYPFYLNLEQILEKLSDLESKISSSTVTVPESWSEKLHQTLKQTLPSFITMSTSGSIKITALKGIEITKNGERKSLASSEYIDFLSQQNQSITIEDLVEINIIANTTDEKTIAEYHLHQDTLKKMKIKNFEESEAIHDQYLLTSELAELTDKHGSPESLRAEFQDICDFRLANLELWEEAVKSEPLSFNFIEESLGIDKEIENIQRSEDFAELGRLEIQLDEHSRSIRKMELERDATNLLFETLNQKRAKLKSQLSPIFNRELSFVSNSVFGEKHVFSVEENLTVSRRNKLDSDKLSIGAKESLGLLVRLTLGKLSELESPLPIILDDDFAYIDLTTTGKFITYIKGLDNQQVILFTHQPEKFPGIDSKLLLGEE